MRPLCFGILYAASGCAQLLDLDAYEDREAATATATTGGGATGGGSSPAAGGTGGTTSAAGGGGASTTVCGDGLCVFVSQTPVRPGANYDFDSIGEANALCTTWAMDAGLRGAAWRAWLSDGNGSALGNLGNVNGPWFDRDGELMVTDKAALTSGSIETGISRDQHGVPVVGFAWTGTLSNGTVGAHCNSWDSRDDFAQGVVGQVGASGSTWTQARALGCNLAYHLYCFEVD